MWQLAVMAGIGAAMGGLSTWQQSGREKASLEKQKESALYQYLLGRTYSDRQYDIQKDEALYQAETAKRRLDQNVDASIGQMNLGLLSQAFARQDARIAAESNIGASLAAEGMSGAKGNAAGELMRAYERQGLERNISLQDKQTAMELQGLTTQASNAAADIRHERESWDSGGYRYAQKQAQDDYNLNMAVLGQNNFDWQINQANPTSLDYLTGVFSGASSGFSLGSSISGLWDVKDKGGGASAAQSPKVSGMTNFDNSLGINPNSFYDKGYSFDSNFGDLFNKPWLNKELFK